MWNAEESPINANSGMEISAEGVVTSLDSSGNVQPFAHLQRLGDKLIGGVITSAENAIDQAINPSDIAKPVSAGASPFLPQSIASYIERNMGVLAIGGLIFLAVALLSVRR